MISQQLIISGVGGQGILFITRLLAEIAIDAGYSVLTSETHGMAQRGGVVISHLKIGSFTSPLVGRGQADGMILLKGENSTIHGELLKPGGWVAANGESVPAGMVGHPLVLVPADKLALAQGDSRSLNLIVLGAALQGGQLFCSVEDAQAYLHKKLQGKHTLLQSQLAALTAGMQQAREVSVP